MEHLVLEAGKRNHDTAISCVLRGRTRAIVALALLGLMAAAAPVRAADVDLTAGVLSCTDTTFTTPFVANALVISLATHDR